MQTKLKRFFSNTLTAIHMKPRQHNYLKQSCMPLKSTITEAKDRETNWFNASESIIRPLRDAAQCAYKSFLADGSNANRQHWQASCRRYHRVQRQAKKQYFNQVAVKASKIAMRGGPKEAWEAVRLLLEKGSTAHHCPPQELHFRDPNTGNIATTPEANLEILRAHCHKVYNCDGAPVDFSILDDIFQRPTLNTLGMPLSTTEDPTSYHQTCQQQVSR
jgi:hypothetical protein